VSIVVRNERLYEPGPWDESAAWFAGPTALDAPLRPPVRTSVSFSATGYHILRGHDPSCYGAFRCGSLRDRFSQIDMLHLDVWWRGLNVLVDAGSYMYNGPAVWHNHFFRTSSHNTVEIDGRDQMLHFRKFKVLYLTEAKTLHFEDGQEWALCEGEHYGYLRAPLRSVHRRAVLFVKDDLWIVVDRIIGRSPGSLRLHWLCEAFPYEYDGATNRLTLSTPAGPFSVSVLNESGQPMPGEVVAGRADPPRGWLSRYYAEKTSVPSFSVNLTATAPVTLISILSGTPYDIEMTSGTWVVRQPLSQLSFRLTDGRFTAIRCDARP
jgi:asparagine synthase (glutamine-hydrolysing)